MDWAKENRIVEFEIQITTQIKDVIKHLLHTYYETRRSVGKSSTLSDAAWMYSENEFVATYLGHILHYVEGMIIAVRDKRGLRMLEKFTDYFRDIGMPQPLQDRAERLCKEYATLIAGDVDRVFVDDKYDDEGVRRYDSLFIVAGGIL